MTDKKNMVIEDVFDAIKGLIDSELKRIKEIKKSGDFLELSEDFHSGCEAAYMAVLDVIKRGEEKCHKLHNEHKKEIHFFYPGEECNRIEKIIKEYKQAEELVREFREKIEGLLFGSKGEHSVVADDLRNFALYLLGCGYLK